LRLALRAEVGQIDLDIPCHLATRCHDGEGLAVDLHDHPVLLDRLDQPVDEALQIDIDIDMVVARIAKRAAEEGRSDDTEETVRKRMEVYAAQTAPVVDYYGNKGVLSRVLGEGSIDEVFQRIKGVLQMCLDS